MVVGSSIGWIRATELKLSDTSDTVLSDEREVVELLPGRGMVGVCY